MKVSLSKAKISYDCDGVPFEQMNVLEEKTPRDEESGKKVLKR